MLHLLEQIRDEAKETNARLESLEGRVEVTNTRLESLEGRVEVTNARLASLEGRVGLLQEQFTQSSEIVGHRLEAHLERIDQMSRRQTDSELRLASEVLSLAAVTRDVRDLLSRKFDDHEQVLEHERRIRSLEDHVADR